MLNLKASFGACLSGGSSRLCRGGRGNVFLGTYSEIVFEAFGEVTRGGKAYFVSNFGNRLVCASKQLGCFLDAANAYELYGGESRELLYFSLELTAPYA